MNKNKLDDICFYHLGILEDRPKYLKLDIIDVVNKSLQYMDTAQIKVFDFKSFNCHIWQKHEINLIHQFLLEWEQEDDYYNLIYQIILEQLTESTSHLEKIILFYLLYCIYESMFKKVLISLNQDIMNQLFFFFEECKERHDQDVLIIFNILHQKKAFLISSRVGPKKLAIHPSGLPYAVTKRNKEKLKDIIEEKQDEFDHIQKKNVLHHLQQSSESYHKSKMRNNVPLKLTDQHFVQRCIHTLQNISQK